MEKKKIQKRRISKKETDSKKPTVDAPKEKINEVGLNSTCIVKFYENGAIKTLSRIENKKFIPSTYHTVIRRMNWNQDATQYFCSEEGRLQSISPSAWKKMSKYQRLQSRASYLSEGRQFEISILGSSEELSEKPTEYMIKTKVNKHTCKAC